MLYIVSTPIGNLGDITFRAIEVLKGCDYILCEDTRHSRPLLRHYDIDRPLVSYHAHNEMSRTAQALIDLQSGSNIALLSDAGTPTISDPGTPLIDSCHRHNITVAVIPGPCAAIAALTGAGIAADRFQFVGFLPKTATERLAALRSALDYYPGITVCYESPQRLVATLQILSDLAPSAYLAVARELTKYYEEIRRGSATELLHHYKDHPPRGEIVLLIHGGENSSSPSDEELAAEVSRLCNEGGQSRSDAVREVAAKYGFNRRSLYQLICNKP